jgi:hypothetical protein
MIKIASPEQQLRRTGSWSESATAKPLLGLGWWASTAKQAKTAAMVFMAADRRCSFMRKGSVSRWITGMRHRRTAATVSCALQALTDEISMAEIIGRRK